MGVVERQMQIIENLIQRKVSVLIVAPSGSREIVPVTGTLAALSTSAKTLAV